MFQKFLIFLHNFFLWEKYFQKMQAFLKSCILCWSGQGTTIFDQMAFERSLASTTLIKGEARFLSGSYMSFNEVSFSYPTLDLGW
jgi:hypothetical protein